MTATLSEFNKAIWRYYPIPLFSGFYYSQWDLRLIGYVLKEMDGGTRIAIELEDFAADSGFIFNLAILKIQEALGVATPFPNKVKVVQFEEEAEFTRRILI